MFAFTSPDVMGTYEFTAPPQSYLSMISRGLKEIGITKEEIVEYFLTNPEIEGESTRDLLFRYIFVDYSVRNSKQLIDMLAIVSEIVLKIIKVMSCQLRKKLMTFIFYLTNPTEANTM